MEPDYFLMINISYIKFCTIPLNRSRDMRVPYIMKQECSSATICMQIKPLSFLISILNITFWVVLRNRSQDLPITKNMQKTAQQRLSSDLYTHMNDENFINKHHQMQETRKNCFG